MSPKRFAKIYNNLEAYPAIKDVASKLKIAPKTVRNKAALYRARRKEGESDLPPLVARSKRVYKDRTLMSESSVKFCGFMSPEDCIQELRQVAEAHPDQVISRNFFRCNGAIAESVWNRHFGTFEEFKRQAKIKLSRAAHGMERKIAVHVSRDVYRRLGEERIDLDTKYIRDSNGKWKTILVGSDLHDIECDPFWLRVFIDTAKRIQPDVICLNGDVFDLSEFGRYDVDPREWDVVGRIQFVHDEVFSPLREVCPDAQIDLIEGNHEARLMIHLADATPALKAVLSDLHGLTVEKLLGLDQYEINYVGKADLAATSKFDMKKELAKSYKQYYDIFIAHHFPYGKDLGMPGWNGHCHRHEMYQKFNPIFGAYEWHQLGAGHRREATYCEGEKWANGFLIANCNVESKSTNMDYVQMTDFSVVAGDWYYRTEEEGAGNPGVWPGK